MISAGTAPNSGLRTLDDLGDVSGRRVLVRVDFNVPLDGGQVADDTRIRLVLPTLRALRERGARLLLISHLGRPKGRDPALSLRPVVDRLALLLGDEVVLAPGLDDIPEGDLVVLENIRYEPGETKNDPQFAARLGALADVYVNDAFGSAHRAHASTEGVVQYVARSAAGLLFEREVEMLGATMSDPQRPLVAVLGGSKATDKIAVIERFLEVADAVLLGGGMGYPFLAARGRRIGNSLCDAAGLAAARRTLELPGAAEKLRLAVDLVVADGFSADAERRVVNIDDEDIEDGWEALDIGPRTRAAYAHVIHEAGTVFWNGPVGAFELAPFAAGTHAIADAVVATDAVTVVGGGDSIAALAKYGVEHRVTHLSTGGGASLEFVEGRALPGVVALLRELAHS
jgi:phosphoglycerate kinase